MDHKNYSSNHMSLFQLMRVTGSVCLVTMLAFASKGEPKAEQSLELANYNVKSEPITINYNDTTEIANLSKEILKDKVSMINELTPIENTLDKDVYSLDNYIINIHYEKNSGLGLKDVKLTIQDKFTAKRSEQQKLTLMNNVENSNFIDGIVNEYSVKVNVVDSIKPEIILSKTKVSINKSQLFDINDYIKSVYDNYDGKLDYQVKGEIKRNGLEYKPGVYTFKISAVDSSGNTAEKELKVNVSQYATYKNVDTSNYKGPSYIVDAAYAQLGEKQDCTRLVSDSLAAAGIKFHGWPWEYFALGYEVSYAEARPGDLIYYAIGGSNGLAHIAVYVGNGMSIHGGWEGNTVLYKYKYSTCSTPRFIRII